MGERIDLSGQMFGDLTVIEQAGLKHRNVTWLCRCSCGTPTVVKSNCLRRGTTKSCGCRVAKRVIEDKTTHGEGSARRRTPEYRAWLMIKVRCDNPKRRDYKNYGARGIDVCDRWRNSYEAFLADVGRRPSSRHSIDRVDVDRGYEPGNVRWASVGEQSVNKQGSVWICYMGIDRPAKEWSKILGVCYGTLTGRRRRGYSPEEILFGKVPTASRGDR